MNYCIAPAHVAGGASIKRISSVEHIGPTRDFGIRTAGGLIQDNIRSITKEGRR